MRLRTSFSFRLLYTPQASAANPLAGASVMSRVMACSWAFDREQLLAGMSHNAHTPRTCTCTSSHLHTKLPPHQTLPPQARNIGFERFSGLLFMQCAAFRM